MPINIVKMSTNEMIEKAYERMTKSNYSLSENNIKKYLKKYIEMPFNALHMCGKTDKNLEDLLIGYAATQCNNNQHPMTCGVNSQHELLVPRLSGSNVFLVCPTCGYLQFVGLL